MPTKSAFSVGLAHKVCLAAEEHGYTPELLNALAEHPTLFDEIRKVQLGFSEIKPIAHAINCDAAPYVPDGWSVEEHRKDGQFAWSPGAVELYRVPEQESGCISGTELRKKLQDAPVLNATVLDYLLKPENQHLISEEWKGILVFFWGTIYRYPVGYLCVRYLCWHGGGWCWSYRWLDLGFHSSNPALVRAS